MEKQTEIIDQAQQLTQMHLDHALANRKPYRKLAPKGECYHCGEELPEPKLFCDGECSARWSKRNEF